MTVEANPAVTRFFRNTVDAAVTHYAATSELAGETVDLQQLERINVLRGLQSALTTHE